MKAIFLTLTILSSTIATAQQWCASGAQWYHEYSNLSIGDVGYVVTNYVGDTIIDGDTCQNLEHITYAHYLPTGMNYVDGPYNFYTSVSGNVVYIWSGAEFDTLINYGAVPGDQWQFAPMEQPITVIDTGHVMLDAQWLKFLSVAVDMDPFIWEDTIYERIGPLQIYLNMYLSEPFLIDYGFGGLRCYSDNEMSYSRIDEPCEIALGIDLRSNALGIEVFPNPASHQLCIRNLKEAYSFELFDQTGSIVLRSDLTGTGSNCFPVLDLATGAYILRVICKDHIHREKVIIEN